MLNICEERESGGSVCRSDMGDGLPFRSNSFDGCVSISAVQWLCNADRSCDVPKLRLKRFFTSLYRCLVRGSRAVLQFYPHSPEQAELITTSAMKAGFSGGLVVDYPNSTKAKKYYLVLSMQQGFRAPQALSEGAAGVHVGERDRSAIRRRKGGKVKKGSKEWILKKKDRRRRQGHVVRADTKYTGRKRSGPKF